MGSERQKLVNLCRGHVKRFQWPRGAQPHETLLMAFVRRVVAGCSETERTDLKNGGAPPAWWQLQQWWDNPEMEIKSPTLEVVEPAAEPATAVLSATR